MGFSGAAAPPIAFSTCLVLVELYLRFIDRRRLKRPYFAQGWCFAINVLLWTSCITLAAMALKKEAIKKTNMQFSLLSFQLLWMQAAVLNVYHLRLVLFHCAHRLWIGFVGLGCAASIQLAGAVLSVNNVEPVSLLSRKGISVACLHGGWALYYAIFLSWFSWICSGGRLKELFPCIIGDLRLLWLFFTLIVGLVVGGIPLTLWCQPQIAFLIVCTLQWLFCTIPVVTSLCHDTSHQQLSSGAMQTRISSLHIREEDDWTSESNVRA